MSQRAEFPRVGGRPGRGPSDPNLRVGDAERNEVADALSQHYSDGRLDAAELKERLDRAMEAKTRADLGGLLADLPLLTTAPPPRARRRGGGAWVAVLAVLLFLSAPWEHVGWPWMPRVPWILLGLIALVVWRSVRRRSYRSSP